MPVAWLHGLHDFEGWSGVAVIVGINLDQLRVVIPGYQWRVKSTASHHIDILGMIYNFRIVTTPRDCELVWDRGWCYFGRDEGTFIRAVLAAMAWDGSDESEPLGFDKRVGAG